jgi:hypothetical protein
MKPDYVIWIYIYIHARTHTHTHTHTCIIRVAVQGLELGWFSLVNVVIRLPPGRPAKWYLDSVPSGSIDFSLSHTQSRDRFWSPPIFLSTECRGLSSRDEAADHAPAFISETKNSLEPYLHFSTRDEQNYNFSVWWH